MTATPGRVGAGLALGALALITACSSASGRASRCAPSPYRHRPPLIIAHAGGEGLGPANSLLAMQRSMAAGADLLDADLWMTSDGVIVAHHDRNLASGTDGSGNIDEHTWADLQTLDLRSAWKGDPIAQPVRIASLDEILSAFPDVTFSLEIKQATPSMAKPLCDLLASHHAIDRVHLSAKDDTVRAETQVDCAGSTMVHTIYRDIAAMRQAHQADSTWCAPAPIGQPPFADNLLDAANIDWAHERGMAIYTWTVDDAETLRRLADAGVDAVYTRRPDIAHTVFAKVTGS
jgi:glycerophosphoryl diester phosphodiesterase